ncbi:MAG: CBS domain-containing protein [Thaumarchaeota archaeon]|nr:CBS domain-containing protein [Nitrososphaerota archaeon]
MTPSELTATSVADVISETRPFSSIDKASTLIGYLRETNNYEAFVEEEGRTSIVTIRDLLGLNDTETRLSKLMHQVPRLNQSNTVGDAASLMFEYRTRSIPVYEGSKLLGVVTSPEIVGKMLEEDVKLRLSSIMTPSLVTLESSSPISAARELMRRKKIDQIPVVDGSKLKRVVTSAEIVFNKLPTPDRDQKGARLKGRYDESVGMFGDDAMQTNEVTDSLQTVFRDMRRRSVNYSIIMNTGEVQGIATCRDFMKLLVRKDATSPVPMYVVGLPEDSFAAGVVREKFLESVHLLMRVFPDINEARAVIELEGNNPQRKKNLVKVTILSPKERYSYEVFSYDLGESFDLVHAWAKKLVIQKKPNRRRKTEGRAFPQ